MDVLRNKPKRKTLIVGILLLIIFEIIIYISGAFFHKNQENELYKESYAIQTEIEKVLSNVFTISEAYVSFMTDNTTATKEETEIFLEHVTNYEESYVKNIAFVKDTTITFNYPYEENVDSIGVDLSTVDSQREDVLYVKNNLKSLFIGPIELVQGGKAFIMRTPVTSNGVYYGQISTIIDADEFITLIDNQADKYGVEIKLGYEDHASFLVIGEQFDDVSVTVSIENTNLVWNLSVYELDDTSSQFILSMALRVLGLCITVLICYYFYKNSVLIETVKHKATHDSLTNAYNRSKFAEDYEKGKLLNKLVAFLDINKFKVINDTLGHQFGDWGLVHFTNELNSTGDFVTYRNSGDEFILVSTEKMTEQEFLHHLNNFNFAFFNDEIQQYIEIKFSVGLIEELTESISIEDMLMYLDYAMYDAKKQNKTYTLVDMGLMEIYREQKRIEQFLIEDINQNNFVTFYQPIIDIKNKKVDSVEVLSRWNYNSSMMTAGNFIHIVKKIKYIEQVDINLFNNLQLEYQVLKKKLSNIDDLNFAVNLSAETLKSFEQDFEMFDKFIENIQIPRKQLILEISEDINLGIISNATLEYIKSKGFNLVIDDFGSGVSKLSDVLSGKLLAIKIDKSMLPRTKDDKMKLQGFNTIIKAINATGSNVFVEGVETIEQLHIAKDAGCNMLQGYYFAKPMSFDDVVEYIENFDYSKYVGKDKD